MILLKPKLNILFTFIFSLSLIGEVKKEPAVKSDLITSNGVFKVSLRSITLESGKKIYDMSGKFICDSGKEVPVFFTSRAIYFQLLKLNKKSIKAEVTWKKSYKSINDASLIQITLKE